MTFQPKTRGFLSGVLLGVPITLIMLAVGGFIYLRYGNPPVATADPPFPYEERIVHIPLNARIDRQLSSPPFSPSVQDLDSGARIYLHQCAMCHGTPGHDSPLAKWMYPTIPQLWEKHKTGDVGVSGDDPGETYWKIANGIRLTGMPAFSRILSQTEMWQVTLLLKRADSIPLPVSAIFTRRVRPMLCAVQMELAPMKNRRKPSHFVGGDLLAPGNL
jgi:thiosulfate dehydrogenase